MVGKNNKLRIGIDADDVTFNFWEHYLSFCQGRNPPLIPTNELEGPIWNWFGLGECEFKEIHREFAESPYYDSMPLMPGFVEALPYLTYECDSVLITARSSIRRERTLDCIKKQIPANLEFKLPIYFSNGFHKVGKSKGEICRELERQVHIDDNPQYVDSCIQEGVFVLLFDHPWNRNYSCGDNVVRVLSWGDVIENLKLIKEKLKDG